MRTTDIEAVGELLGEATDATAAIAEETHAAIAKRTFDAIGPAGEPVRRIHDGIAKAVYRGVRFGLRAASEHGTRVAAQRSGTSGAPPLTERPRGSLVAGAVNGLWGDRLAERGSPLALDLQLRVAGRGVPLEPGAIAEAFPDAKPRLAVFLHGLMETEDAWRGVPARGDAQRPTPYGERLAADLGFTPIYLRFNSGLRISANGAAVSELLDELVAMWPVAAEEVVLVGHSLGGLVARSACHRGEGDDLPWVPLVRHVFCLGTPHLGADLEKGVHLLDRALAIAPESRAFAGLLRARSVGVKDLRYGAITHADWHGHDPDEFLRDRVQEAAFLPSAHYYFIGARLTPGPLGHVLGDLLVRAPSASGRGRGRSVPFELERGADLPGLSHFDLLNHDAVYDQLHRWIAAA